MSSSLLTSCQTIREKEPSAIPADRIDCVEVDASERPSIAALPDEPNWQDITPDQARAEYQVLKRTVLERERVVTNYIVDLEGRIFHCAADDRWIARVQSGLDG